MTVQVHRSSELTLEHKENQRLLSNQRTLAMTLPKQLES